MKTIGILGGMGPEASAFMFSLIIRKTQAVRDQDHIPVIIYSHPGVPPRTPAIQGKGPSPVPMLICGAKTLMEAGVDFVVMPCITAHYFIPEVMEAYSFPFMSLLDESVNWAKLHVPGLRRAGLISSTGTLMSRLFYDAFESAGIEVIAPEDQDQARIMDAIFGLQGIKAGYTQGYPRETIIAAGRRLASQGAEAVIAGCTEIPLVLRNQDLPVPLIEPMTVTALAAIRKAGGKITE